MYFSNKDELLKQTKFHNINEEFKSKEKSNSKYEWDLFNELYTELCFGENGEIEGKNLYRFLLAIINLHNYHLLLNSKDIREMKQKDELKTNLNDKKARKGKLSKTIVDEEDKEYELKEKCLQEMETEIASSQVEARKFGGFDSQGNYFITPKQSTKIKSYFSIFSSNLFSSKVLVEVVTAEPNQEFSFKPTIDTKSKEICNEFRKKIQKVFILI